MLLYSSWRRDRSLREHNRRLVDENHRLARETQTDTLTGLRNRRYILDSIERDIALVDRLYADALAEGLPPEGLDSLFLFFDLDDFKEINDRYGHAIGDRILVQVRWLLENTFRESDSLIRWGGDEFLVVARHTHRAHAAHIAERLRRQVSEHRFQLGHGLTARMTCSIGFACYPFLPFEPTRLDWREVLRLADRGQYMAKHRGRNGWVGITPLESTPRLSPEELTMRLATDVEGLIDDGFLEVTSSPSKATASGAQGL